MTVNELFPDFNFSDENIQKLGTRKGDEERVILVAIYTRERLFAIRNKRRKHDESMEGFEEYLYNSLWPQSWRSVDSVNQFRAMLVEHGDRLSPGIAQFQQFVVYVKRFVVWCGNEPQFDMIFSVAPRIRRKIESCISRSLEDDQYNGWLQIEKQIHRFYQGKGW